MDVHHLVNDTVSHSTEIFDNTYLNTNRSQLIDYSQLWTLNEINISIVMDNHMQLQLLWSIKR